MSAVSASPASKSSASSIHVYALLSAVVLVPLGVCPDHLVWFDITPKVTALILMVGLACITIPSSLLDRATERKCADRKSTRLNSSHLGISYAVFCLKKK